MNELIKNLKEMISFNAISGNEYNLALSLKKDLEQYSDSVVIDKIGNVIAKKGNFTKIALFSHIDSVGFIVKSIGDDVLEVVKIGDPEFGQGTPVIVLTRRSNIFGRLFESERRYYVSDFENNNKIKSVQVGDFVSFAPNFKVDEEHIISRHLDNKLGCLIATEVFKKANNLSFVGSINEEISNSGAGVAAYILNPDLALIIDVTSDDGHNVKSGDGPVICLKDYYIPDGRLVKAVKKKASQMKIKLQFEVTESGGSDGGHIFGVKEGVPFLFVGIAIKYMHSPNEIASIKDIEKEIRLVTQFVNSL